MIKKVNTSWGKAAQWYEKVVDDDNSYQKKVILPNLLRLMDIKKGEQEGIQNRFLTKNRSPWYALEKRDLSNIWAPVFNRKGLKFVWNTSDCRNLTCFHSFYPKKREYLDILFVYLNTNFAKKLFDREKREYGDGLDKFEPNDINKSLVLNFEILSANDFNSLKNFQTMLLNSKNEEREDIIHQADLIFKNYYQLN